MDIDWTDQGVGQDDFGNYYFSRTTDSKYEIRYYKNGKIRFTINKGSSLSSLEVKADSSKRYFGIQDQNEIKLDSQQINAHRKEFNEALNYHDPKYKAFLQWIYFGVSSPERYFELLKQNNQLPPNF